MFHPILRPKRAVPVLNARNCSEKGLLVTSSMICSLKAQMSLQSRLLPFVVFVFLCLLTTGSAHAAGACPASVPSGITTCYYADYLNGADANSGTSETSPWKHIPGMTGSGDSCSGNCAAVTPRAGMGFILRGGTVWPYTVFPFVWTWAGKSSGTSPGCTGSGCIYIGIDTTWFTGAVNSVAPLKDYGGCPPSGVTASISGGGGSGAAVTPVMIGGQANFNNGGYLVAYYNVTSQGSGYTSNPTVTVSGSGCYNVQAIADIHRAVWDLGANASQVWTETQMVTNGGIIQARPASYTTWDSIEIRNTAYNTGAAGNIPLIFSVVESPNTTIENLYIHNWYTTQAHGIGGSDGSIALNSGYNSTTASSLVQNNYVMNGDAAYTCTNFNQPAVCGYGTAIQVQSGVGNATLMKNNHMAFTNWEARGCPGTLQGNDLWGTIESDNGGHANNIYIGLCGSGAWTMIEENNLIHNTDIGANSQTPQGNGNTWYIYNNVAWTATGSGTQWGIDTTTGPGSSQANIYFWNNTIVGAQGTGSCINVNASGPDTADLHMYLYNNQCISDQSANHWFAINNGNVASVNGAPTPSSTTADSANTIMTQAVAAADGFTVNALPFAPIQSFLSSLVPSGQNPSPCSTALAALCFDIDGVARPGAGTKWGPGAYYNGTGKPSLPPPIAVSGVLRTN
jgi:hypothetical protein